MTGATPEAYRFERLVSSIWLAFIRTVDNKCRPLQHHDRDAETLA